MPVKSKLAKTLIIGLYIICAALLLVEFLYHRHGHFDFELWFGFYAGFGLLAYLFIVLSATQLRKWLQRSEDYYD